MRIAVDARELCGQPTGVGTYLSSLLRAWGREPAAVRHDWLLYAPTPLPAWSADPLMRVCVVPGRPGTWWEQRALAEAIGRDKPDVLFAPGYTAPFAIGVPVVLTIHDVSFFAHHEWFAWREGLRRRLLTKRSAHKAHTVLTVSQFSKDQIVRWIGVPPNRVRVVYSGIARTDRPAVTGPREPVVLFVGSIFNRRRVPDLLRAFAAATADVPEASLEVVGDNRTHPPEDLDALAASLGIADAVRIRAYVSADHLAGLYDRASVFVFLSEYEGFGFTPLEALSRGVPPIVLDTPVAREIYKDAALYVRRGDIAATAAAIRHLLEHADSRDVLVSAGERLLARYSWAEAARETLSAIESAGSADLR